MSRSGVQVNQECIEAFNQLKIGKSLKFIVFSMNPSNTEVIVAKTSESDDYDEFTALLPENECRYAVYDFKYEKAGGEGIRNKICFIHWSPDTAKIKSKMVSASSKDTIKRALSGVGIEVQATDFSEVEYEAVLEKVQRSGF